MRRRNRAIVGLVSTVAVVCIAWFLLRRSLKPERILTDPGTILSVECMHKPGNATDDYEWLLTLDATGSGTFTKWPSLFSRTSVPISVPKQIPQHRRQSTTAVSLSYLCRSAVPSLTARRTD